MSPRGTMTRMKMSDGAEIGVYHVGPRGARRGGLVLIQEIFGVTDHIKECCDSYADEGYEVLGPSLYDRESPGFQASYSPEDIQKAMRIARGEHPFDLSIKDAQVCIDALKNKGKVFITGYCYGGTVTWAAAAKCDGLAAASGYYGGQIAQMNDLKPNCPTILHFGREDHGIPMEAVDKIRAAHPDVTVYVYDGVGHGFNSDRRSDYNEEAAKLAKRRTLELFRAHGG
ncbi:MAG TPA: dienelactone hydrolase family protein [Rhizomicrobium sp.]|jgi:carboxymethylenebutenolidase|nr:dienelactone hydrolase family protein [Rhizomicrobium sp.]